MYNVHQINIIGRQSVLEQEENERKEVLEWLEEEIQGIVKQESKSASRERIVEQEEHRGSYPSVIPSRKLFW